MPDVRIETDSSTWRAVKAWAESRLESARATCEAHGHDLAETEFQRGRISALRELLGQPKQNIPTNSATAE